MNNVAIALSTKDKVSLTRQVLPALQQPNRFDLHWFDGSTTPEGAWFFESELANRVSGSFSFYHERKGGPDAAVACALTTLLDHPNNYQFIGLCENDILLHQDWFGPTMALFERGRSEGLEVGAVSARAYEDRILIQRDGYAVMHNLGYGTQIMTREAARLALTYMRTGWTTENRRLFAQLSGIDIGRYWAFRIGEHALCADWGNDRILAAHGLASLALVPSPVEMIGQTPPLEQQGLKIASEPFELLRDDKAFARYAGNLKNIRDGHWLPPAFIPYRDDSGCLTWFAHQVQALGAVYEGDWRLHWHQGFGPFVWKAGPGAEWREAKFATDEVWIKSTVSIPISGPCQFLVSGGSKGGQVSLVDELSGYEATPMLPPEGPGRQVVSLAVPRTIGYGPIRFTALSPGCLFYGVRTQEPQPIDTSFRFDHHVLPPV